LFTASSTRMRRGLRRCCLLRWSRRTCCAGSGTLGYQPKDCLTNAGLTFAEQASYFVANRFRIIQASRKPGPYMYGISQVAEFQSNDGLWSTA
jgi:hypothetical protein